jgi:hypothetical protein
MHLLPPSAALTPIARPPPGIVHPVAHHQHGPQQLGAVAGGPNSFQTQPLDLGVERSGSPKRKASTPQSCDQGQQPVSLELAKKRRLDEVTLQPQQPMQVRPRIDLFWRDCKCDVRTTHSNKGKGDRGPFFYCA